MHQTQSEIRSLPPPPPLADKIDAHYRSHPSTFVLHLFRQNLHPRPLQGSGDRLQPPDGPPKYQTIWEAFRA